MVLHAIQALLILSAIVHRIALPTDDSTVNASSMASVRRPCPSVRTTPLPVCRSIDEGIFTVIDSTVLCGPVQREGQSRLSMAFFFDAFDSDLLFLRFANVVRVRKSLPKF